MMKHKHAELIKAWADGAIIQHYSALGENWWDCSNNNPCWDESTQYRIKPIPKEPVVELWYVNNTGFQYVHKGSGLVDNLRLTFDGDTGKLLTAEVVK